MMKQLYFLVFLIAIAMADDTNLADVFHAGNNKFTTNMFSEVAKINHGKSIVLSAFSVMTPLAQLALVSEGASHDELLNAIGLSNDNLTMAVFSMIDTKFKSVQGIELKAASKIYIPLKYELNSDYAALSRDVFHSEVAKVDFEEKDATAKKINTWVEDQTNHRIKDLVDPNSLTKYTRAILVNALYFKGQWKFPFDKLDTKPENFYVTKEETIKLPTMHIKEYFNFRESDQLKSKMLELPYNGEQASLLIVLPYDVEGIDKLVEQLKDPNILDEESKGLFNTEVTVSLPKLKIETSIDLKDVLQKMNISKVFGEDANLTKLLKTAEVLTVSDAKQKVFIEINEEGAEAAAVNYFGVAVATSLFHPISFDFIADHPFALFLKAHGEIIFNGIFYGS